jgi:hypothetical protein
MMKGVIKLARQGAKKGARYLHRIKRLSAFRTPGGEITEVDLLRLSDRTGLSYNEILSIYESMKSEKDTKTVIARKK